MSSELKTALLIAAIVFLLMSLSGCKMREVREQSPAEKKARLECDYEASKATGYDYIDKAINKGKIRRLCLKLKGYK